MAPERAASGYIVPRASEARGILGSMHHECYICGATGIKLTKDHIFPKGLFPPPLPQGMLTAPACEECQQRLQPDEEYFRTFVAAGSYSNETAKELWDGKIKRSFDNSPGFRQSFANAISTMEWKSPGGVILGDIVGLEGNQERIGNVLRKIVRGVFYLDSGRKVMPFDVKFNFSQVSPMTPPLPEPVREILAGIPLRTVGNVVKYRFELFPQDPRMIVSGFAFYRALFAVRTWPEDVELPPPPETDAVTTS